MDQQSHLTPNTVAELRRRGVGPQTALTLITLLPELGTLNRREAGALWRDPNLTTKIMALVDALGSLVRFVLMPGQRGRHYGC